MCFIWLRHPGISLNQKRLMRWIFYTWNNLCLCSIRKSNMQEWLTLWHLNWKCCPQNPHLIYLSMFKWTNPIGHHYHVVWVPPGVNPWYYPFFNVHASLGPVTLDVYPIIITLITFSYVYLNSWLAARKDWISLNFHQLNSNKIVILIFVSEDTTYVILQCIGPFTPNVKQNSRKHSFPWTRIKRNVKKKVSLTWNYKKGSRLAHMPPISNKTRRNKACFKPD